MFPFSDFLRESEKALMSLTCILHDVLTHASGVTSPESMCVAYQSDTNNSACSTQILKNN